MQYIKKSLVLFSLLSLVIISCTSHQKSRDTHELLNAVLWMQHAAEYKALTHQAYNSARTMLDLALSDKNWTAALEQQEKYGDLPAAIILDVDETVLDNSPYEADLISSNTFYSRESWNKWCDEKRAAAIPGALELCNYAQEKGVTVFYVTNRRQEHLEATRENLRIAGFPLSNEIETILPRTDSGDKGDRRSTIAAGYRILLLIGDNNGDFASAFTKNTTANRDSLANAYQTYWGVKWIVLPNPSYGDWEGALFDYNYKLSDSEKLQLKYEALKH